MLFFVMLKNDALFGVKKGMWFWCRDEACCNDTQTTSLAWRISASLIWPIHCHIVLVWLGG